jgi:hypothetical protein
MQIQVRLKYLLLFVFLTAILGCHDSKINNLELSNCFKQTDIVSKQECQLKEKSIITIDLFDDEDNKQICTGTLISKNLILTAAHCFNEFIFDAYAVTEKGRIKIIDVKIHPKFNQDILNENPSFDIAIAILESEITNISPVKINRIHKHYLNEEIGFLGYGRINEQLPKTSGILRAGIFNTIEIQDNYIKASIKNNSKNICYGDSGGPVFSLDNIDSGVIGIVSKGSEESCTNSKEGYFSIFKDESTIQFFKSFNLF